MSEPTSTSSLGVPIRRETATPELLASLNVDIRRAIRDNVVVHANGVAIYPDTMALELIANGHRGGWTAAVGWDETPELGLTGRRCLLFRVQP